MSLAEELLADLDDVDEEMEESEVKEEEDTIVEAAEEEPLPDTTKYTNVNEVAKLASSDIYQELIKKMEAELNRDADDTIVVCTPLESDPQYRLIVQLSALASQIDNEVFVIHKFVRDKYERRFPELETLVPHHLDYMAAVKLLGNDINTKGQNKELLSQILAPATCIVISVTASTTQGKALENEELASIQEACSLAERLRQDRMSMFQLVQLRMSLIAPNLVALLGAETAAALVAQAGGLAPLARMPACNIQVLGAQKRALAGFSSANSMPHAGILWHTNIVQTLPPDIRKNVVKILANKTALAARPDSQHQAPDGNIGKLQLEKVQYRIEKLIEPPQVKNNKALPKPLDKASKKRGGRRVRKMKERLGMTDMRKKANRMNFGELEEDIMQERLGYGVGQLKQGGPSTGRIRMGVVDEKTRVKMSKTLQRTMEKQKGIGGGTSIRSKVSGTASSVSFTPVQGLEIVNPNIKKDDDSGTKSTYFSSTSSFLNIRRPKAKDEI
uniref:U4/U6 small nuclear ribonucleoprotein Prp31 n=1 Tax=Pristionchus pacificus TaxID=54126 RepID=A0A2A6BLX0_PRIPA|eukprot:PDM66803.1 prp-31 [Pristionchus pacificus]